MMEYTLFKKLVAQRIKEFLPPVFQSYRVETKSVHKINETKDSFCLFPPGRPANIAVPTLYLDEIYQDFGRDEDMDRVLQNMADVIQTWSGYEVPEFGEFSLQEHTDSIVADLISTEMNRELLEEVPHTEFLDLSIIYRAIHSINEAGINSAVITSRMLEGTDLTADDLYRLAMQNTSRLFPAKRYHGNGDGVYVMTNEHCCGGAVTMLYEEEMKELAERIGGDFFILPSSRHEFFAIDVRQSDPTNLVKMLAAGNNNITEPVDRLSRSIYRYDAEEGKVCHVIEYEMELCKGDLRQ